MRTGTTAGVIHLRASQDKDMPIKNSQIIERACDKKCQGLVYQLKLTQHLSDITQIVCIKVAFPGTHLRFRGGVEQEPVPEEGGAGSQDHFVTQSKNVPESARHSMLLQLLLR